MPAGIPRRLTDELAKLGYTIEVYSVDGPPFSGRSLPKYTGVEVRHRDILCGVAEMEPRGWGGDNKWRTYARRTPDGCAPSKQVLGCFARQRDAIAALIRRSS
jgi:hypothetical protein